LRDRRRRHGLGAVPPDRRAGVARRSQSQRSQARHGGLRVRRAGASIAAPAAEAQAGIGAAGSVDTSMLELSRLFKTFSPGTPNEVRALRGVDVSIDQGSFVIVIGTNGSGKSTLLNAVAGGFFVDSGTIRLDGADMTRWPEHRRASLIGRVFQNPF